MIKKIKKVEICLNILFVTGILLTINSCVQNPSNPSKTNNNQVVKGAFVLCEGNWNYNNSSISFVEIDSGTVNNQFYENANPGLKIGDTGNDIVIKGDTAYIAVSTSKTIEAFRVSTGKFINRIKLNGNIEPRKIVIINDSLAYFTNLYSNNIISFNPSTFKILNDKILVGANPEGICSFGNNIFVANSGYGIYGYSKPKAGTISVVDIKTNSEIKNLYCGPNTLNVITNIKNKNIYASFSNLTINKDSLGGIVEYSAEALSELRRWDVEISDMTEITLSQSGDSLFFLNSIGVAAIDIKNNTITQIIKNPNSKDIWYTISTNPSDGSIWIGNAFDNQSNGRILIYKSSDFENIYKYFDVGVNPTKIIFF